MKVWDIYKALDELAPFSHQEKWDNSGLLVGDRDREVTKIVILLDATAEAVRQAAAQGAQLLISHHPVIFDPLKQVTTDSPVGIALQKQVSILSAHTNLDMAEGGVNDCLAQALELEQIEPFLTTSRETAYTLAVFVPETHSEPLRLALAEAGAGRLGNYDHCSFTNPGEGRFRPLDGAQPWLGQVDQLEIAREERVQMVVHKADLPRVLSAMRAAHPYEEPAYDLFENHAVSHDISLGRIGILPHEMEAQAFAAYVNQKLGGYGVRWCGTGKVRTVAVCGGAGGSLIYEAMGRKVDALVTSELKHNQWVDVQTGGLTVVDGGHYPTEAVVLEPLRKWLSNRFPQIECMVDPRGGDVFRSL